MLKWLSRSKPKQKEVLDHNSSGIKISPDAAKKATSKLRVSLKNKKIIDLCLSQAICPICTLELCSTGSDNTGVYLNCGQCKQTFYQWD